MDFNQAEEKFRGLKSRFASGDLTEADFKAQLEELMVEDEAGGWWMIGYETERWYHHDGTNWVQQDPPGRSAPEPSPAAAAEPAPAPAPAIEAAPAETPPAKKDEAAKAAAAPAAQKRSQAAPAAPARRRSPVLFVILGGLALVVCAGVGFYIYSSGALSPAPTEAPAPIAPVATEAPISVEPTEPPTSAPEPTSQPTEAPTEPPTAAPTQNTRFFTEEFDNGFASWEPFVTSGELGDLKMSAEGSRLSFDLTKRQLYAYAVYTPETYDDVRMETQVENRGNNDNNITLFCRYDKDAGWYELSIANSGLYWIYRGKWDSNGVTASYSVIADGGSNNIRQGQAVNTYAMVCQGNTISAYINDKLIKTATDNELQSGEIGIGVSSFNALPVAVDYDWVKISAP